MTARSSIVPYGQAVPHFELSSELWAAMDFHEVTATLAALATVGELHLPYNGFTMRYNVEDMAVAPGWGKAYRDGTVDVSLTVFYTGKIDYNTQTTNVEYNPVALVEQTVDGEKQTFYLDLEHGVATTLDGRTGQTTGSPIVLKYWLNSGNWAARMLLAALATKNVVKHTAFNRRAARGHGNGAFRAADNTIRLSCTRLDVPALVTANGKRVKFHLRRGHYHDYWTGPGRTVKVQKFIQAYLVNKDLATGPVTMPEYEVVS